MCKLMEDRIMIEKKYTAMEAAAKMLEDGVLPLEKISDYSGLTMEEVRELAEDIRMKVN